MTFTGMGPDAPSPRLDPNCQCDCHRQPGVMHVAACCQAKAPASDAVTLSEVQALIAANYRKLVAEITGNPSGTRCDACRSCGYYHCVDAFSGCAGMRDYTLDEATTAIAARDAQMRAEGLVAGLREADGKSLRRVRHVKRGTTYCEIGRGQIQTDRLLSDYADVVVYQCEGDGRFWIRPTDEFDDICRFEKLPPNDPAAKIAGLREAAEQCAKPGTEYERKVAQMKEDFPNGI